ncbi:MAG: TraR/DksA C4-type zinc finger protein [bacterium]
MNKDILQQIEKKLLEEKKNLEKSLISFASKNIHNGSDYTTDFPDYGSEQDENAAEVAAFSDNLSLERKLEKTLQDVNNALKRIEKGEYGKCRYCGKDIGEQRLLARPVSGACVECKKKLSG